MRRSTVILSIICLILFIFTSVTSFCLLLKINKLELHHVEKYEKYLDVKNKINAQCNKNN